MSNVTSMRRFAIERSIAEDKKRITRLLERISYQAKFCLLSDILMPLFNPEYLTVEQTEYTGRCVDATIPWMDMTAGHRKEERVAEINMFINGEAGFSLKNATEDLFPFFTLMYDVDYDSTFEETENIMGDYDESVRDEVLALFNEGIRAVCAHDIEAVRLDNMFIVYPVYVMSRLIGEGWFVDKNINVDIETGFIAIQFYCRDQAICMYYNPRIIKEKLEYLTKELTK